MIPIVTVHSYNAKPQKNDYTAHVIEQSVYLGNVTYSITDYIPSVSSLKNHYNISFNELDNSDYRRFNENYVHMSTNPLGFEKAAIAKFFLLKEFMIKYEFNKIFHIDSDVLLYKSIDSFKEYYEHYDFTLTNNQQCGNSFFTLEVIKDMCDKILKIYIDREKCFWFNDFKKIYENMQNLKLHGGICDMTILKHYKERKECNSTFSCGEMTKIIEDSRFDHHIRHIEAPYEMEGERRKIAFIDNIPNSFNMELKKNIKYLSLHFGGKAKEYLHEYITYK